MLKPTRTAVLRSLSTLVVAIALGGGFGRMARTDRLGAQEFLRGDPNADGRVSTADIVTIEQWLFEGDLPPSCIDSADVDDDGKVQLTDSVEIADFLFGIVQPAAPGGRGTPAAPFPEPGVDPTQEGEQPYMSCHSYVASPAEETSDLIRIGEAETGEGGFVDVPLYVTSAVGVRAVQAVVSYDPGVLHVESGNPIQYEGTFYEQFIGKQYDWETANGHGSFTYGGPQISVVDAHPEDGIFTLSIIGALVFSDRFVIPPGEEVLVAKIRMEASPDLSVGTRLPIEPTNGPGGVGYGPYGLRNEITFKGAARYAAIVPQTQGGLLRIGVDGDISFFIRGDANDDKRVDISDAVSVLDFLFLGKADLPCQDAADADDTGEIEITDAIVILSHLFLSTKAISSPYPEAGADPSPDFLKRCKS
jgi:hypothetical protein